MPPHQVNPVTEESTMSPSTSAPLKSRIVWTNVLYMGYFHIAGGYGLYLWATGQVHWWTMTLNAFIYLTATVGVTAGSHRLWSHKCYKATLPLRILLCIMQTTACQNSIHKWCRDHRLHHKHTETNADPHNVNRGFFFAHVGWLLVPKHEDARSKMILVYMKDLESDPVVMFQKRHFKVLTLLLCFLIPWYIPVRFGETPWNSWNSVLARYILTLNVTWLVNSAAHLWGHKPYDRNINPAENRLVSILAVGEGWHNYHHSFPSDYRASELSFYRYNWTTAFIDFFAWIGWAYELKTVPDHVVRQRVIKYGDGSHPLHHHEENGCDVDSTLTSDYSGKGKGAWGEHDALTPTNPVVPTKKR